MIFRHILVAYDGSKPAVKAIDKAIELVRQQPGTKFSVVHVHNNAQFILGESLIGAPVRVEKKWFDYSDAITEEAKARVAEIPEVLVEMIQGYPAKTIVEYAEAHHCDLIILGSRGLSGLKELVLGSVSHNVVQHASIPVLIIK